MLTFITIMLFLVIAVLSASLRPVYSAVPLKELKRRSSKGDQVAHVLYQVAHHGVTADAFLVLISLLAVSIVSVIIAGMFGPLISTILIGVVILTIFLILPTRTNRLGNKLAGPASPYLSKVLIKIRPVTNIVARIVRKYRPVHVHTGVFTKQDLIDLIEKQKIATGNQVNTGELDIALHALTFGDKTVASCMTPRRVVHFVQAEEPVGPILLTELHESGFSRFPVRKETDNNIVGTLYLRDLVERTKGGIVSNVMNPRVYYVNDEQPLEHVLEAFIRTKHHLFIVVNEFEDVVGIITIEDVLEQILGRKIVDEFDKYADLREVAKKSTSTREHV